MADGAEHARHLAIILVAAFLSSLVACGGGDSGSPPPPVAPPSTSFTIGGTVTGLATGATLTLADNTSDPLSITGNGGFTFAISLAPNATYAVTVKAQPAGQTCTVSGASGTASANVTSVTVACAATTYTIGGTVTGLAAGDNLTLLDNNADTLSITGNGAFTFATALAVNAPYAVTVGTPPTGQSCAVSNASGTAKANVTNVAITCGNVPFALLQLGHGSAVTAIQMTSSRVLSQDTMGDWLLSGVNPDITVASGTSGCLSSNCTNASPAGPIPTAVAGQTVVIETPSGLQIRAAGDGHLEGTIPGPIAWWKLASDGSYVATGSATGLQAWSLTGKTAFSVAGNYAAAVAFAAPDQIQVALGAAGTNVIQTVAVPAGTTTVGAVFNGTFSAWFLDGGRFLTNTGQTIWVYSAASVQQDEAQLSAVQNLAGDGNWFWSYPPLGATGQVSVYAVGSSSAAAATYPLVTATVGSGSALAVFSNTTPSQVTVVDLSGATIASNVYSLPIVNDTTFAAASAAKFVVGNTNGVVLDGTTLSGTPQYLSLGAAESIAGGGGVAAIATAAGKLYVINPATQTVQNSLEITSSQIQLSADGSVLAAISDLFDGGEQLEPLTLRVLSLPTGSLINTFTGTSVSTTFSLSGSGTLIETGPGVTAVTGGPVLWAVVDPQASFLFSTAGTDFVTGTSAQNGGTFCTPSINFYENYTRVNANTIAGAYAGWIDQDHVLVNAYTEGDLCQYSFTSASIYDATGALVSATTLPELRSIQAVSSGSVYSRDRNAIYSLTTGQATWSGPSVSGYASTGAVAGSYVVYPSGASVVAIAY
jgi:hypothetical protein